MLFKGNIVVLGINAWKMEEENKEGTSLFYLSEGETNELNKKGFFPIKKSFPRGFLDCLNNVQFPQLCEVEFSLAGTVGNKMDINISKIVPIGRIDLWEAC